MILAVGIRLSQLERQRIVQRLSADACRIDGKADLEQVYSGVRGQLKLSVFPYSGRPGIHVGLDLIEPTAACKAAVTDSGVSSKQLISRRCGGRRGERPGGRIPDGGLKDSDLQAS